MPMSKPKKRTAVYVGGQISGEIPERIMKHLKVFPDESIDVDSSRAARVFLTKCGYHKRKE